MELRKNHINKEITDMSLQDRMRARKDAADSRQKVKESLYKNERSYRADRLIEAWSRVPEVGAGLKALPLVDARNVAINLDRQASFMGRLNETQTSSALNGFTPENMLRLVRLAMPNVIRNKIFTEFAMETSRDSIKYIEPVVGKSQNGKNDFAGRTSVDGADPWGTETAYDDEVTNQRRALYELTEDRIAQELENAPIVLAADIATPVFIKDKSTAITAFDFGGGIGAADAYVVLGKKDAGAVSSFDEGFIDGYLVVYKGGNENDPIVLQNKNQFYSNGTDDSGKPFITKVAKTATPGVYAIKFGAGLTADEQKSLKAYARFDSETDFEGDYLGEVELRMHDYQFVPRPTMIGITWSTLSEINLDASFSVSAEELLVSYASQEIRVALDYRAIKLAWQAAKTAKAKTVVFNAGYSGSGTGAKDGYYQNAQTFMTAVETVGDNMLNKINRGGVSRLVAGPSAGSYMRLNAGFSAKGAMRTLGCHQIGEIETIPLFKVPSKIIPSDSALAIWKNDDNEADVSIAFGTLVPFFSSGIIQRKNFYKEASLATYGDYKILQPEYLSAIKIIGLKDKTIDLA